MGYLFRLELIKLLLKVAWADHRVVRAERDLIRDLCRKLGMPAEEIAQVEQWLPDETGVPSPNIEVLKPHKAAVLAAVRTMVMADNRIAPEEAALLAEIEIALK